MPSLDPRNGRALISRCGHYRYWLTRHFCHLENRASATIAERLAATPNHNNLVFVMLNPSTADAAIDDPTIRRCIGYARDWGYSTLVVINLYALRATNPADLWKHDDPVGPHTDAHIRTVLQVYKPRFLVCAWGSKARANRVDQFKQVIRWAGDPELMCLATTKDGAPRHPLYLRKDAEPQPWKPNAV